MHEMRFYNLIFPLFLTIFLPPYIIIPLIGNLIIDGMVYYIFLRQAKYLLSRGTFIKLIFKAWGAGLAIDLAGAALLITAAEWLPWHLDIINIWNSFPTIAMIFLTIVLAGIMLFQINRKLLLAVVDQPAAARVAIAMAVITAPWFFLIPASWLNNVIGLL